NRARGRKEQAAARNAFLTRRQMHASKPTVGSNCSIPRATKFFCLELDEFPLLIINLPCAYRRKNFSTIFVLEDSNCCAGDIAAKESFSNIRSAANRIKTVRIANAANAN